MHKTWHVLEDYTADAKNSSDRLALTPEACYQLRREDLSYRIPEDYYEEDALSVLPQKYLERQYDWIYEFAVLFQERLPNEQDFFDQIISYSFYRFKYLIDSIYSLAFAFRNFIRKENPSSIVYCRGMPLFKHRGDIQGLYDNDRRFMHDVFKIVCQEEGVAFTSRIPSEAHPTEGQSKGAGFPENLISKLKDSLKPAFYFMKYRRLGRQGLARKPDLCGKKERYLFLCAGHRDLDPIIAKLIAEGNRVYLKTNEKIYTASSWSRAHNTKLRSSSKDDSVRNICKSIASSLYQKDKYINMLTEILGCSGEQIMQPYLTRFIEEDLPRLYEETKHLVNWIKSNDITYVVSNNATNLSNASALIAARMSGSAQRVCYQHGCHAVDFPMWPLTHAPFFDHYYACDPESRAYAEETFPKYNLKNECHIEEYSSFLPLGKGSPSTQTSDNQKETIVYLPTRMISGIRLLNAPSLSMTWYYHLQIALLDHFASRKEKQFIFKYAPANDWLTGSTLSYLKDKTYPNITISGKPYEDILPLADRVILDTPGTAFYETAVTDIPVLSLYLRHFKPHSMAEKYFKSSLQPFDGIDEAISIVDSFLNSDPNQYRVKLMQKCQERAQATRERATHV